MFGWFKESTEDKYFNALSQAHGEWTVNETFLMIQVELKTANEIFVFTRESFLWGYAYFEKIHETKRAISKKFFLKIYELAKEYIAQGQIDKLGGYILDEDLQQAINDTKRVMNAQSQIEVLYSQVEKIRKKYQ
ncbi:MAG: hypothetical protein Q4A35_02370 [Candidatus Gracilibacteria bacterium]|nr:hypothetical protein [Candidatus Gracilibacteria bacterium]